MKKKNVLVLCAASSLCLAFALLLSGGMGIYAEKAGTQEFEPKLAENEASDMLTEIITEDNNTNGKTTDNTTDHAAQDSAEEDSATDDSENAAATGAENTEATGSVENATASGGMTEEGLINIWNTMYEGYKKGAEGNPDLQEGQGNAASGIGINDAGLILLREINRLYPQDSLTDLTIQDIDLEPSTIPYSAVVYWTGTLQNGYGPTEESYRSYTFQIDSISGKIMSFGKFRPYQKDKDYSAISWTDEKIKEHARLLIETYDLSQGETLDWDSAEITHNGKEDIDVLKDEFEERPDLSTSVHNTLVFEKDGWAIFYFCMDWETGEISNYLWTERNM